MTRSNGTAGAIPKAAPEAAAPAPVWRRAVMFAERRPALTSFSVAMLARAVVCIGIAVFFEGGVFLDDATYSQMAAAKASGNTAKWDSYTHWLYGATGTFLVPVTAIYSVLGPVHIAGQLYAALLGAATAGFTARLAMEVLDRRWALAVGLVVALLPSQVLWSSLTLKDSSVWALLAALGVVMAVANRQAGRNVVACGVAAVVVLLLLAFLRRHTLVVASVAMAVAAWLGAARHRVARGVGFLLIATFVPVLVGIGPLGATLVFNAGSLEDRRVANAQYANSAYVPPPRPAARPNATVTPSPGAPPAATPAAPPESKPPIDDGGSVQADLRHLPRGLLALLLRPFPWEPSHNAGFLFARLETLVWYPVLGLAAMGLVAARRNLAAAAFPVLAAGGILMMYALTEGNLGTAYRHRGEAVWAIVILAGVGAHHVYRIRIGGQRSPVAPDVVRAR